MKKKKKTYFGAQEFLSYCGSQVWKKCGRGSPINNFDKTVTKNVKLRPCMYLNNQKRVFLIQRLWIILSSVVLRTELKKNLSVTINCKIKILKIIITEKILKNDMYFIFFNEKRISFNLICECIHPIVNRMSNTNEN